MKSLFNVIIHPITICALFSCLIISGQATGFLYIVLLVMGFLFGFFYCTVLGIGGIIMLLISLAVKKNIAKHLLDVGGAFCMLMSLILFFTQPGAEYNYGTFHEPFPLIYMLVFLSVLLTNIVYHLQAIRR